MLMSREMVRNSPGITPTAVPQRLITLQIPDCFQYTILWLSLHIPYPGTRTTGRLFQAGA